MRTGKKRYICSFVKKDRDGNLKPNVVVVAATNEVIARSVLCSDYNVPNVAIKNNFEKEGIKTIRLSETNKYEGEPEGENFGQSF
jgi:hypothetical protein